MQLNIDREIAKCERFLRDRIAPHIETTVAHCSVGMFVNPGEPETPARVVERAERGEIDFAEARFGERWGTTWGTTWFRLEGSIPAEALHAAREGGRPLELVADLGWLDDAVGGHIEGMLYRADGRAVKAVHPMNGWVRVAGPGAQEGLIRPDGSFCWYLEAACNPLLVHLPARRTDLGDGPTGRKDLPYVLKRIDVCAFNGELWNYARDLEVVGGLAKQLDRESMRCWRLARALRDSLLAYDDDRIEATLPAAREALREVLAAPANASTLHEHAIGHAHIDSAYLWPIRETRRKVARTVSNVLALMDQDPNKLYAMSSAQQYAWLEEDHPELFARMKERIREGRFLPVGGMWVEADGMMPAGESMVRQISFGKRYFRERLGVTPHGIWLPDSFGYTAAWPQIARKAGYDWFLTQKISWGDTTKFPHHSFLWEGVDGTEIFTHFPPTDTYAAEATPQELVYAEHNFRDKTYADQALLLYGYGDGGGGPTREMTGRLDRMANLEGLPTCDHASPDAFFEQAERQLRENAGTDAPRWRGELYLEFHRATLTAQQAMKRGCRTEENLVRTCEYLAAAAATLNPGYAYPAEQLDRIWRTLLLNQFHDILPGSALSWVHREARADYERDEAALRALIDDACRALREVLPDAPVSPTGVISQGDWRAHAARHLLPSGQTELPGQPDQPAQPTEPNAVSLQPLPDGGYLLSNGLLRVAIAPDGTVPSLIDVPSGREIVAGGERLGTYSLMVDKPSQYDAWELERDSFIAPADGVRDATVEPWEEDATRGVRVKARLGSDSAVATVISLAPGERSLRFRADVDWNETDRFLKALLPLALRGMDMTYECQYGTVTRSIPKNTDWQEARFESCTHRFMHMDEGGYGVAVINASTYGASAFTLPASAPGGRSRGTLIGLSLVSAPTYPDPHADSGSVHRFDWRIDPGVTVAQTVALAGEHNAPVVTNVPAFEPLASLSCTRGHAVIDWIKLADDGSGDLIVRLYEPCGGTADAVLHTGEAFRNATVAETDLLEQPVVSDSGADADSDAQPAAWELALATDGNAPVPAEGAALHLAPYQIATLRLSR